MVECAGVEMSSIQECFIGIILFYDDPWIQRSYAGVWFLKRRGTNQFCYSTFLETLQYSVQLFPIMNRNFSVFLSWQFSIRFQSSTSLELVT